MSDEAKPEDINYIFTNSRCYHPFFGDARVLLDKKNKKLALLFTLNEATNTKWWFDEQYSFIIIEDTEALRNGFVKLKDEGGTEQTLSHCGVDVKEYPIFSSGETVMFYSYDEDDVFVRFDGIVADPIQYDGEYDAPLGEDAEQWFSGAEYLQTPSRLMPDPLIDFSKTTLTLFNYRDPTSQHDVKDIKYSLEIDTSTISAWGKTSGYNDEDFCGEYVGLGANADKTFRLGYGKWEGSETLYESQKTQQDGSILIDGLTFLSDEDKFVYHDTESEGGYWWTAKENVKLGNDIILTYEQGNGGEDKPQKTFAWQGYTWYAPKEITDKDGNTTTVDAPLHTEKINAMDAPVWR